MNHLYILLIQTAVINLAFLYNGNFDILEKYKKDCKIGNVKHKFGI